VRPFQNDPAGGCGQLPQRGCNARTGCETYDVRSPQSDTEITAELVSGLVAEQHPQLLGNVTFAAHGWDADIYRLGDEFAVRMPHRLGGVSSIANEQRWLPTLAPQLPVPVPVPVAIGRPGRRYPWPWSIVPWFVGEPADRVSADVRDSCAAELAQFLIALHVPAPPDAPSNAYRGVPLPAHDERVHGQLKALGSSASAAYPLWLDAISAQLPAARVWVHGDLHPGNALLRPDSRLAALIDFGDLCVGDPAVDLAAAWLFFTPGGREDFRRALDGVAKYDANAWRRARGWALVFSLGLIFESDGSDRMTGMGHTGLAAVLSN
jgi:aminoglycoside phosphotransferase (APT) family kinase protein